MFDNTGRTEQKVQIKTIEKMVPFFRNEEEMIAWYDIDKGPKEKFLETKVILLVGGTGAGKSTMVNVFANYLMGVESDSPVRFEIDMKKEVSGDSQESSQTKWATAYTFHNPKRLRFPVTIVDSPGFGDTSGLQANQVITQQIRKLFDTERFQSLNRLDALCVVVQSPNARLTPGERYVFNSVTSMFGKDVTENLVILVTFADLQDPPVLKAVKAASIPCRWDYRFNNSTFLSCEIPGEKSVMMAYWNLSKDSFKRFFEDLEQREPVELKMTRKVMELENEIKSLEKKIVDELEEVGKAVKAEHDSRKQMTQWIKKVIENRKELEEIAMQPHRMTIDGFIDTLIDSENIDRRGGYKERLNLLLKIKEIVLKDPDFSVQEQNPGNDILNPGQASNEPHKSDTFTKWLFKGIKIFFTKDGGASPNKGKQRPNKSRKAQAPLPPPSENLSSHPVSKVGGSNTAQVPPKRPPLPPMYNTSEQEARLLPRELGNP
ncbi:unnamed protein product [Darwinula stevensoni]|uniref:AIG1-type G domain-containing protein n=1 Tax=Darwinula stevensoni TaxID=69355 RepID=A0A7R9FS93_9CRUS|nr:unnamed protein product [Darwinula stevensoni]CAG0903047.1 unnamed protein product [Darwinula stevensoni]